MLGCVSARLRARVGAVPGFHVVYASDELANSRVNVLRVLDGDAGQLKPAVRDADADLLSPLMSCERTVRPASLDTAEPSVASCWLQPV